MDGKKKIEHPETSLSDERTDKEWFRNIVESTPNGIIVSEHDGRIVMSNRKAQQLFGYSADEFIALTIDDLVPDNARHAHQQHREAYQNHPEARPMGVGRDLHAQRKDGFQFPVEIGLTPLKILERSLVLSTVVDISERQKAERALIDAATKLQFQADILKHVHDAVFYFDHEDTILEWNQGATRIFDVAAETAIGGSLSEIFSPGLPNPFQKLKDSTAKESVIDETFRLRLNSGKEVFVRARAASLPLGMVDGYVVCASDVTDRKKLEAELVNIAEDQQRKIGQDIHDDLCSQLSGIGCITKVLENQMRKNKQQEAKLLGKITEMVAAAGLTARDIAKGLVPSVLEIQGLVGALRELSESHCRLYGINCSLEVSGEPKLEKLAMTISIQIYRIAQEAISNAIRHSDADTISIHLSADDDHIDFSVTDDGKGMSEDLISAGMGLITMRRRAELIHAIFDIHASPGEGTKIHCSIPRVR